MCRDPTSCSGQSCLQASPCLLLACVLRLDGLAQLVHQHLLDKNPVLDLRSLKDYVSKKERIISVLPTVGFINLPGAPGDGGKSLVGDGAVILTEKNIMLFSSRADRSGSASETIGSTTMCGLVADMPGLHACCSCAAGCCGCIKPCRIHRFGYQQLAHREHTEYQHTLKLALTSAAFENTSLTQLTRAYGGIKGSCVPWPPRYRTCPNACSNACSLLPWEKCYFHGMNSFSYAETSAQQFAHQSVDELTVKHAGHNDAAWSLQQEMRLVALTTDAATMEAMADPTGVEARALMMRHFGGSFTHDQVVKKMESLREGVTTTDFLSTANVMALKLTHWDAASQAVRTTVAVCDAGSVSRQDMMKFQVDVSFAETADSSAVHLRGPVNSRVMDSCASAMALVHGAYSKLCSLFSSSSRAHLHHI